MAQHNLSRAEIADIESHTSEQIFPLSMFSSADELYRHALEILSNVMFHQELIYKDIPPDWAQTVLDRLDEEFEGRFSCHQPWAINQKARWNRAGLTTTEEDEDLNVSVGTTISFVSGPYANSRKEPDLFFEPGCRRFPSLVMESGWSESLSRHQDDVNLWLVGGQGEVKATIILNWQRVTNTDTVKGSVYLYTLDRDGIPRLKQNITVFPAPPPAQAATEQLVLSRREIFGGDVHQGRNPNDEFTFSINLLREMAIDALGWMGLVPA
ncbi:hypothetical protein Plec18167_001914 [Paecilomyces lecythidis]|uniref:Uncharacterized protein n=1 Tax=Paecilomyces lecythidis TaxID=3004212 RepID=A0ABR3YAG0_9EURO